MGSPAVGDLNGDGIPDIVVGTNENYSNVGRLYAVDGKSRRPFCPAGRSASCPTTSCRSSARACRARRRWPTSTATACPRCWSRGIGSVLHVYDAHGKPFGPALVNQKEKYGAKSNARNPIEFMMVASPSVGDLDNDGIARSRRRRRRLGRAARLRHRRHSGATSSTTSASGTARPASSRTASRRPSRTGSSSRTRRSPTSTATASPR